MTFNIVSPYSPVEAKTYYELDEAKRNLVNVEDKIIYTASASMIVSVIIAAVFHWIGTDFFMLLPLLVLAIYGSSLVKLFAAPRKEQKILAKNTVVLSGEYYGTSLNMLKKEILELPESKRSSFLDLWYTCVEQSEMNPVKNTKTALKVQTFINDSVTAVRETNKALVALESSISSSQEIEEDFDIGASAKDVLANAQAYLEAVKAVTEELSNSNVEVSP